MFKLTDFEFLNDKISEHYAAIIDNASALTNVDRFEQRASELMGNVGTVKNLAREYEMLAEDDEPDYKALAEKLANALWQLEPIAKDAIAHPRKTMPEAIREAQIVLDALDAARAAGIKV